MSAQTGRMVSADEAREIIACGESQIEAGWGGIGVLADVAHTVVVQAEQIEELRAALASIPADIREACGVSGE